jgi:ABC-type spermidine/putrescine transport system permease subunit I
MKIVSNIELFVNWGAASALGVVLLVITVAVLWVASRFVRLEQMTGGR